MKKNLIEIVLIVVLSIFALIGFNGMNTAKDDIDFGLYLFGTICATIGALSFLCDFIQRNHNKNN